MKYALKNIETGDIVKTYASMREFLILGSWLLTDLPIYDYNGRHNKGKKN